MIAVAALAAVVLVTLAFTGVLASRERAHARERNLLIAQLLHATGNTWQEPPATAARRSGVAAGANGSLRVPPEQLP